MNSFDTLHAWTLFKRQCTKECKEKKCCLMKLVDKKFILNKNDCVSKCIDREFHKLMEIHQANR